MKPEIGSNLAFVIVVIVISLVVGGCIYFTSPEISPFRECTSKCDRSSWTGEVKDMECLQMCIDYAENVDGGVDEK